MSKEELLAVLKIRYNTAGLKQVVAYFILETLDEDDVKQNCRNKKLIQSS